MNPYTQGQAMPGMEFFQSLLKGSGMPTGFASWMAPTMDPQELEQKITDLKAVLQWLEANARLTQATIQTLEVQRMTLSALKTMNVDLGDLANRMADAMQAGARAMGASTSAAGGQSSDKTESAAGQGPEPEVEAEPEDAWTEPTEPVGVATGGDAAAASAATSPLPGVMDPMQWWNAVSQQFSQVATQALRESPWPMPPGTEPGKPAGPVAGAFSAAFPQAPNPETATAAQASKAEKAAGRRAVAKAPARKAPSSARRKPPTPAARTATGKSPAKAPRK